MKPGMRVTSPRSIILAFAGTVTLPAVPTAVIVLSVTTTTALLIGAAPVPSISRAAFSTTTPLPTGGSGVIRVDEVWAIADKHSEWTRHNATQTGLKFFKVAPLTFSRKQRCGCQTRHSRTRESLARKPYRAGSRH